METGVTRNGVADKVCERTVMKLVRVEMLVTVVMEDVVVGTAIAAMLEPSDSELEAATVFVTY